MNKAMSVPAGYRFYPRDHELITYLVFKIAGKELPSINGVVLEADLFSETPPWEVFANAGGNEPVRYFFTKLKQKTKNGKNFKRTVGDIGTWRGDRGVDIMDPTNRQAVIGEKRTLTFRINNHIERDIADDCKWLMTEYTLAGDLLNYKRSRFNWALCQIKKKKILRKQVLEEVLEEDSDTDDDAAVGEGGDRATTSRIFPPSGVNNIYHQFDSRNPVSEEYCNYNNYYCNQLQNPHQGLFIPEYKSSAQAVCHEEYNNKVGLQSTYTDLLLEDEDESAQASGGELEFYLDDSLELWVRPQAKGVGEGDNYHNNLDHHQGFGGEAAVGVEGNSTLDFPWI